MPNETNATTRLAMMRAVQKLRQANIARVKGAPGIGYSTEQMAEIVERETGYRELYEALESTVCDACENHYGWTGKSRSSLDWKDCSVCAPARAALAKVRGETADA